MTYAIVFISLRFWCIKSVQTWQANDIVQVKVKLEPSALKVGYFLAHKINKHSFAFIHLGPTSSCARFSLLRVQNKGKLSGSCCRSLSNRSRDKRFNTDAEICCMTCITTLRLTFTKSSVPQTISSL